MGFRTYNIHSGGYDLTFIEEEPDRRQWEAFEDDIRTRNPLSLVYAKLAFDYIIPSLLCYGISPFSLDFIDSVSNRSNGIKSLVRDCLAGLSFTRFNDKIFY